MYNDFPKPTLPPPTHVLRSSIPSSIDPEVINASPAPTQSPLPASTQTRSEDSSDVLEPSPQSSIATNKENAAPSGAPIQRPPVPSFSLAPSAASTQTSAPESVAIALPPDLLNSYQQSTTALQKSFAHSPPYTIQRLAELVLYPKKHYRHLPPYLAALSRVVSVSSPVSDFPLPQLQLTAANGGFLTNGDTSMNGITERGGLGSDESLGGALLTPIPWLRRDSNASSTGTQTQSQDQELKSEGTETIEGPNGVGSVETVSVAVHTRPSATETLVPQEVTSSDIDAASSAEKEKTMEQELRSEGAVTQGELLRQEQEAGVVPQGQMTLRRTLLASGAAAVGRDSLSLQDEEDEPPEEHPHARGPDTIGPEDMGPQERSLGGLKVLDMEAAVGRAQSPQPEAKDEKMEGEQDAVKEGGVGGPDAKSEDWEMVDKDTVEEEAKKKEGEGEEDAQSDDVMADSKA